MYSFRCDLSEHMCTAQAEPLSAEESEEAAPVERKKPDRPAQFTYAWMLFLRAGMSLLILSMIMETPKTPNA